MENINPSYKEKKYNIESELFAYVDESGDEGFDFNNTDKWFVVSALATTFNESNKMLQSLYAFNKKYKPRTTLISRLSLKYLNHSQRKNVLGMLNSHNYLTVHSAFYKPKIDPNDDLCTYPSMYFIGIKNIIERLSWLTQQFNKDRIHILISSRNHIKKEKLAEYLFEISIKAQKNLSYIDKIGRVSLSTPNNHKKLIFSDYTASSIFQCLEKRGEANIVESIYFEIFLKNKMFSSDHPKYKGVWRNGFKCTPDEMELIQHEGILEEGAHKLSFAVS